MKFTSLLSGILAFALLTVVTSSSASAQFGSLTTPTPTVAVATPTPTLVVSPLTGGGTPTPAATTPTAGDAMPTMLILGSALALIGLGALTFKLRPSTETA